MVGAKCLAARSVPTLLAPESGGRLRLVEQDRSDEDEDEQHEDRFDDVLDDRVDDPCDEAGVEQDHVEHDHTDDRKDRLLRCPEEEVSNALECGHAFFLLVLATKRRINPTNNSPACQP